MPSYPLSFQAQAQIQDSSSTSWQVQSGPYATECAVPPEFQGPGGAWSPEDLFAQALLNCFVGTFKVLAQNSKLTYQNLQAQLDLTLDLDENKRPIMKSAQIRCRLREPSHPERAEMLAKKAFQSGFILNSVKTALHFEFELQA
jgi:organic hydroperoxide reductase OsmC/OhrA